MTLLRDLQFLLTERGIDAYLVPCADVFFGEEVRACDARLAALTGFGGSAGLAVVRAKDPSDLLVDGRYTAQAKAQIEGPTWRVTEGGLSDILETLQGCRLAYDPWLFTSGQIEVLEQLTVQADPQNLVDQVWTDRPSAATSAPSSLSPDITGEDSAVKRARLAESCEGRHLLITQPDALAWLMNWRGTDLTHTPVHLAFGLLSPEGEVQVFAPDAREDLLVALEAAGQVQFDPAITSVALVQVLGDQGNPAPCPITVAKAVKNATEIAAMRTAQAADGLAVTKFLRWYAEQDQTQLTELDLAAKLADFRAEAPGYAGPSFETISGAGPNGAIPHYRLSRTSNRQLRAGELVVLDSGGQYPGATTDITRTLPVGQVSEGVCRDFTLVLQGLINLTLQQFPVGTTGQQLDVLARSALWNAGLNYNHGTGHGVGAGLSVHEAPPNVSPRARLPAADWALKPGMMLSNEPGLYLEGRYGIRCENLLLVVERNEGWLGFETLTNVPFDESLIVWELLTPAQVSWLKNYQKRI